MKLQSKNLIKRILLTGLLVMIQLIGNCQFSLKESKKDSTQLTILRQVNDPAVKRQLLRIIENYPKVKQQQDSCEKILSYQKTVIVFQEKKIKDGLIAFNLKKEESEKIKTLNLRLKSKLKTYRLISLGIVLGVTARLILPLTKYQKWN